MTWQYFSDSSSGMLTDALPRSGKGAGQANGEAGWRESSLPVLVRGVIVFKLY